MLLVRFYKLFQTFRVTIGSLIGCALLAMGASSRRPWTSLDVMTVKRAKQFMILMQLLGLLDTRRSVGSSSSSTSWSAGSSAFRGSVSQLDRQGLRPFRPLTL